MKTYLSEDVMEMEVDPAGSASVGWDDAFEERWVDVAEREDPPYPSFESLIADPIDWDKLESMSTDTINKVRDMRAAYAAIHEAHDRDDRVPVKVYLDRLVATYASNALVPYYKAVAESQEGLDVLESDRSVRASHGTLSRWANDKIDERGMVWRLKTKDAEQKLEEDKGLILSVLGRMTTDERANLGAESCRLVRMLDFSEPELMWYGMSAADFNRSGADGLVPEVSPVLNKRVDVSRGITGKALEPEVYQVPLFELEVETDAPAIEPEEVETVDLSDDEFVSGFVGPTEIGAKQREARNAGPQSVKKAVAGWLVNRGRDPQKPSSPLKQASSVGLLD